MVLGLHLGLTVSETRSLKVLIIDDDTSVGDLLAEFVQVLGHESSVVPDGREALERFTRERYDVVISDLVMPVLSGWEVVERLRRLDPRMPVIVLSGGATRVDVQHARRQHVLLLHKPIRLGELDAALHEACAKTGADRCSESR